MKHRYILFILLICCAIFSNATSLTEEANKAYQGENYFKALDLYTQAAKKDGVSSELYYNIGNCYYRLKNTGKAVLYYERALNLNPANQKALTNLEFVNSKIVNRTDIDESNIISQLFNNVRDTMTSNMWAIVSIIIFILFLGAIALYIFTSSVLAKKIGFFGGIILLLCDIIANYYAYNLRDNVLDRKYAVVTVQSVVISNAPRAAKDKSEEVLLMNEGNKVLLLDSVDIRNDKRMERLYKVKADDSHEGWVNKNSIEII